IKVSDLAPATRRGRAPIGLAALAAALLAIGFLFAPAGPRTGAASPFERTPVDGRLLVIGWDGMPAEAFEADLAGRQGGSGDLAVRGRFVRLTATPGRGRAAPRPSFWTGVATGRPASRHGVEDAAAERITGLSSPLGGNVPLRLALETLLPGRQVAVSSGLRRAKTLWEILGEREGAGSVGWWATWP